MQKESARIEETCESNVLHEAVVQPAPDALDELRDTVHCVAVVRHDAAHAPLHM